MTSKARGDELIERILTCGDADGKASNDLIGEVYTHDYPVEKLIPLLRSDNNETLKVGAFLAEEMGAKAGPLLPELTRLLGHADTWVKSGALTAVLASATGEDGEVVGGAVSLITDSERPIRRMAFELMARLGRPPLVAGVPYVKDLTSRTLLQWVLEVEGETHDDSEIVSWLQDSDEVKQLFAAIAAARVYRRNPHYLQLAASSHENDVHVFAASEFAWLSKLQQQAQRRQERSER
jgi:hypothetical protein